LLIFHFCENSFDPSTLPKKKKKKKYGTKDIKRRNRNGENLLPSQFHLGNASDCHEGLSGKIIFAT